jgi:hypothetical protein
MLGMKVIAIVALATPFTRAAHCSAKSGECQESFDETSLIQVNKKLEQGSERLKDIQRVNQDPAAASTPPNPIEVAEALANKQVYDAAKVLREKISDVKVAKANDQVQKWAVGAAKLKLKEGEYKYDRMKAKNYTAYRRQVKAKRAAIDAAARATAEAEAWDAAQKAEDMYRNLSQAAEQIVSQRDDAYRNASAMQAYAKAKYQEAVKSFQALKTIAEANLSVQGASTMSDGAATARMQSDMADTMALNASGNAEAANAALKAAMLNMTKLKKAATKAEARARRYARAYRMTGGVAVVANMSEAPVEQAVEETEESSVVESSVEAPAETTATVETAPAPTPNSETKTKSEQTVQIPR